MAEGVVLITESSSDGESSGGGPRSRRRRQLKRRKRRRRRLRRGLEEPLEVIDLTGDDVIVRTAACSDFGIIDLTEAEENMISPLHESCYAAQGLKYSTPVSMHPTCSPTIFSAINTENKLDVPISMWDRDGKPSSPKGGDAVKKQPFFQNSSFSFISSYGGDSESSSHTTYNSDLGSLGSPQLGSDVFSFSSATDSSECQAFLDCMEEAPGTCQSVEESKPQLSLPHQRCSPSPIPNCSPVGISPPLAEPDKPLPGTIIPSPSAVKSVVQEPTQQIDIKVWLKTLQYFQGVPVHHPFLQNVVQDKDASQKPLKVQPIPSRRLSMVSSTIEENFFQGTLDFLTDFVSCQYYPPKEITSFVVRQILLSPEQQDVQQETQKDAYMLLMKIQALHPAKADTVVWDWQLLQEVMEEQNGRFPGQLLFLQYVIQTLEDDFQRATRTRALHKSIAKAVLSCDQCFSNVKEVIEWLVAAVMGVRITQHRRNLQKTNDPVETFSSNSIQELHINQSAQTDDGIPQFQSQKEVALLQRMLSLAIEVDKSPNCSAHKIVDMVFSSLLNIPKRCQREAFLSSMECHLLRCKVLELIFHHSCKIPPKLPLSVTKILYFLNHFSLLLTYQDNEVTWQRWDEMLHQLILLLLSYRNVVLGHLRSSVCERVMLIIKAAKPKLQLNDCVERNDVECNIKHFQEQLSQTLGQPIPPPIKEKTELLQVLLLTAIDN